MHFLLILDQLDQVGDRGSYEPADIASKIEELENRFDDLQTRIINELSTKPGITAKQLLSKLTRLPLSLRKEYESSLAKRIHRMLKATQINDLFIVHLNDLSSFMDYGLIEYFIKQYGSDGLKKDMVLYCSEMVVFMKETTIEQLRGHLPGEPEVPPKFSLLKAKIGEDPSKYTLEEVNIIRKQYCSKLKLSEIVLHLLTFKESESFIVWWVVPSALVSDIMNSVGTIDQSFYQEYKITSLTLDGMWLFLSESEIDAMWLKMRVGDTELSDQFHIMHKQILCEVDRIGRSTATDKLSSYLVDQQPTLQRNVSVKISKAILSPNFPISPIDFRMLTIVIELSGSDSLKRVMESYCRFMSTFVKQSTSEQLIDLSPIQSRSSEDFVTAECKIKGEPFEYGLEKLFEFQTQFCSMNKIDKVCFIMGKVDKKMSGSFTLNWHIPSAAVSYIVKQYHTRNNISPGFYKEYKITSLTLDKMWLFLSEAEIDAMWSKMRVGDTELSDQFHIMHKQILCEVDGIGRSAATYKLSSYLMDQQPDLQQDVSVNISKAFLNSDFPVSLINFRILTIVIELFGSNCLKRVMESYCRFMSTFVKQSTLEQLIDLPSIQSRVPEYFITAECKIKGEPFKYRLEKLLKFQTQFCSMGNIDKVCFVMGEVCKAMSCSFTVNWRIPSAVVSYIVKFTRNIFSSFYQEYKITSLTLDGMWLHMSESEIDAMWSELYVSDAKFKDRFRTMCKQIVYEMKVQNVSKDDLSLYFQTLHYQPQIRDQLSLAVLNYELPASFVDFGVLKAVIERFGSDCLERVIESYCNYISIFTMQSTAQQLINLSALQSEHWKYFVAAKCKIMIEPSHCRLEKLLQFRTRFCAIPRFNQVYFILDEVNIEMSGSFTVSWLVPSALISNIIVKCARYVDQRFYQEYKITSFTLDGMWLFLSEAEIDSIWLKMRVGDTEFNDQFHIMHKQILCEVDGIGRTSATDELSSYLMNQQSTLQQDICVNISKEILSPDFPISVIDFRALTTIIELFGSDCLKRVMESYCHFMSTFVKQSTLEQLINLSPIQSRVPEDFLEAKCKIKSEPFEYGLEKLLEFQTKFCSMINIDKVCFVMGEVGKNMSGSFTISWRIPSAVISYIVKFTRNIKFSPSFHEEYKIASLTLDGMWIFLSDAEIDVLWHPSHFESQFLNMYRQVVYELKVQEISKNELLSYYLTEQQPKLQSNASIQLSEAFLEHEFPLSVLDFRVLSIVIDKFGGDCLKSVMKSFHNYVISIYTRESTVEQLVSLPPIPSQPSKYFISVESRNREDPTNCRLARLLDFQARFCAIVNIEEECFMMDKIKAETSGSFVVRWYVPSNLALDLLKSANQLDLEQTELFQEMNIASLQLGSMWLYNYQLTPLGIQLKKRYQQSQGSPSPVEWIPSPTKKIFRLAMIQRERVQQGHIEDRFVRMSISGRVDDILYAKSPVELEHIFRNTLHGGEIILIEGAPGSGKSTLTVHICQRWGKGDLFQQFTVVILVQLRDPAVQRAQTIADLLPIENVEEIAAELIATNGRGVLWVLDGWDELPPHLQQDSIFCQLIKRMLSECSVLVTSRPISSGDLHPVVSSRIEVLGFTPEEQRQYFTECLKGDTKALEALLEKIQQNPVLQSICYLPLSAAFIVYIFKYRDQSLPNTGYEIYLSVILSCIQRHYDREGRGHDLPRELASLDDLSRSEAVREPFQCLCELAYRGVMENKVTFSSSDLPQGSNTLSLLQAIESFLQSGNSVFYNFLHLSIQEVLSAYYMTIKLSDSEQVSQFQQLFNQPRFAAVFQFYAAITKLKSPGIHQVIDRILEAKSKPLLVSLLRCLHEAQDPALCLYVAERLERIKLKLNLSETSLSPLDCVSVSFFLSSVAGKEISINLKHCAIGNLGVNYLSKYVHTDNNLEHVSKIIIDLTDNEINEEGALHITNMLYLFEHLYMSYNPIGDTGASLISEAMRETATLKTLILYDCRITSRGAEDLSRALAQNNSLEKLDIGWNDLGDDGISHVAEALKQNKQLKELWIGECGMTDKGAHSLASALKVNDSLKMLHMGGCKVKLTKHGLSAIAHSLANNLVLVKLVIPFNFGSTTITGLNLKVSEARKKNGLPPIEVEG